MFPTAHSQIYRNEAGEVTGWDNPGDDEPYDPEDYLAGIDYDEDDEDDEDDYDEKGDDEAESHLPHNPVTDRDETGGDEVEMAEEGPEPDEPDDDEVSWQEYGDAEMARWNDDPNPYHGDYSEM